MTNSANWLKASKRPSARSSPAVGWLLSSASIHWKIRVVKRFFPGNARASIARWNSRYQPEQRAEPPTVSGYATRPSHQLRTRSRRNSTLALGQSAGWTTEQLRPRGPVDRAKLGLPKVTMVSSGEMRSVFLCSDAPVWSWALAVWAYRQNYETQAKIARGQRTTACEIADLQGAGPGFCAPSGHTSIARIRSGRIWQI